MGSHEEGRTRAVTGRQSIKMDVFPKEISAVKSIFKSDSVSHDNKLFKLHHQVNYFFVLLGIVFIFGQNYLGNPIQCYKEDDGYVLQFCWYHGSGHLPDKLSKNVSGCIADQKLFENGAQRGEYEQRDQKHTKYYIWLPFVLGICLVIIKTPRFFWKNMCERGLMESIVANTPEKMAARIRKLKGQRSFMYFLSFFFCEILNIISVVLCAIILDSLLGGNFWNYGTKVHEFYYTNALNRKSLDITNPMCNVFPTEVSLPHHLGWHQRGASAQEPPVHAEQQHVQPVLLPHPLGLVGVSLQPLHRVPCVQVPPDSIQSPVGRLTSNISN